MKKENPPIEGFSVLAHLTIFSFVICLIPSVLAKRKNKPLLNVEKTIASAKKIIYAAT